jgi:hypothetical protein
MGWIISVCAFYLDKLVMSVYEIQKVNLFWEQAYKKLEVKRWGGNLK